MHDSAKGGAWPLLVGELICLLNCVNERDLCQLLDGPSVVVHRLLSASRLIGSLVSPSLWTRSGQKRTISRWSFTYWDYANLNRIETRAQSRSVMLLKKSGLHAHYTDSANELLLRLFGVLWQPGPKGLGNLLRLSRDGD